VNLDTFAIRDDSMEEYSLNELGEWATLAFKLGYESFSYSSTDKRCVTIVSVPSRDLFTSIVSLGALVADAASFRGDGILSWEQLIELENGLLVYFKDRNKIIRGYLGDFVEDLQARTIEDARSVKHFVTKSRLPSYEIKFNSPKSKGKTEDDEHLILDIFKEGFGLVVEKDWLRTVHPKISLNIVKHNFLAALSNLEVVGKLNSLPLSSFLSLTESSKPGSGKIFLKSEKNANADFVPKMAILSSSSFEKLIREYSQSDLVITLEHHEYDESIASVARSLRQAGEDSPNTLEFSQSTPSGVRLISKVMRRVI
jgi:hypothetical protein